MNIEITARAYCSGCRAWQIYWTKVRFGNKKTDLDYPKDWIEKSGKLFCSKCLSQTIANEV